MSHSHAFSQTRILIREFDPLTDSIENLTRLLNKSYQTLADMGFRFLASHQDQSVTAKRIANAYCLVGFDGGNLVGTISYYPPAVTKGAPWYDQPHVAKFGQFAVDQSYRNAGIGDKLLQLIEAKAREEGVVELALDTAEGAYHLIRYYASRGYRLVDTVQWDVTNYRSVLMSKQLV